MDWLDETQPCLGCLTAGLHEVDIDFCFESAALLGFRLYLVEGAAPLPSQLPTQWLVIHPDDVARLPRDAKGAYLGDDSEGYSVWFFKPDRLTWPLKVLRVSYP